jgi:hypothetical protein
VTDGRLVFAAAVSKNHGVARADGRVDRWQNGARLYVPSMLVREGTCSSDTGQAVCWKSDTGRNYGAKRWTRISASPVMVGNRIYATSLRGMTSVFEARRNISLLAQNQLRRGFCVTAICGNRIYLRTAKRRTTAGISVVHWRVAMVMIFARERLAVRRGASASIAWAGRPLPGRRSAGRSPAPFQKFRRAPAPQAWPSLCVGLLLSIWRRPSCPRRNRRHQAPRSLHHRQGWPQFAGRAAADQRRTLLNPGGRPKLLWLAGRPRFSRDRAAAGL